MGLRIIHNDQAVDVPREIEAADPATKDAWVAAAFAALAAPSTPTPMAADPAEETP